MMPGDHHDLAVVLFLGEQFVGQNATVFVGVRLLDGDADRSGVGHDGLGRTVAALGLGGGEDEVGRQSVQEGRQILHQPLGALLPGGRQIDVTGGGRLLCVTRYDDLAGCQGITPFRFCD